MPGFISTPHRPSIDLKMRNLVHSGRPAIDIVLESPEGQQSTSFPSYSSMDRIEGVVTITPQHDTKFDDVEVVFEGLEKTYVDKVATTSTGAGRVSASHKFLRLLQPISPSKLPSRPSVLVANETYVIPFVFVIPAQMLPRACRHKVANNTVRHAHLQLPPSLGDPELAGHGAQLLDDMAPEMAKITYAVKATITRSRPSSEEPDIVAEKSRKIRIRPAFEEQPPLSIDAAMIPRRRNSLAPAPPHIRNGDIEKTDYSLRAEKTLKKGLFKGKLGDLAIESSQPSALHVPFDYKHKTPITSMATVRVRFDPSVDKNGKQYEPPQLGSLTSKLKVSTYYAVAPRQDYPTRHTAFPDVSQGMYSESLPLASRCVESAQWTKHSASTDPTTPFGRRDSAQSTMSSSTTSSSSNNGADVIIAPSSAVKNPTNNKIGVFYTATLRVPIALPISKHLVPTFHTCLISRIYALTMSLSIQSVGPGSSLTLRVPVQVSAEGSPSFEVAERQRNMSVLSAVMEDVEEEAWMVDQQLRPRSLVVNPATLPSIELQTQRSRSWDYRAQAPPGYEALSGVRVVG